MFITLLGFSKSLATKCVSLNNEPCMMKPFLIDLDPIELKYYPFTINLDKCNRSCNSVNDLSRRVYVPSKTKDVNVKVFDMKTDKNEEKTLVKQMIVNENSIVQLAIQIKNTNK